MTIPTLRRGGSPLTVRRADSSNLNTGISRIDPWNDITGLDRLFSNVFRSPFPTLTLDGTQRTAPSEPQVELYETGDELLAYLFAPGLAADSIDLSAGVDTISIQGERKALLDVSEGMTSHTPWAGLATSSSTWSAAYSLPIEIDPDKVQASYKDGVLHIRMPKSEASKPRQVKIQLDQS